MTLDPNKNTEVTKKEKATIIIPKTLNIPV